MFDSHSFANSFKNHQDLGVDGQVSCWEEVVRCVNVETGKQKIGEESCNPGVGIVGCCHSMLSKILNSFSSLAPQLLKPMSTEKHSVEQQSEYAIDEHM